MDRKGGPIFLDMCEEIQQINGDYHSIESFKGIKGTRNHLIFSDVYFRSGVYSMPRALLFLHEKFYIFSYAERIFSIFFFYVKWNTKHVAVKST